MFLYYLTIFLNAAMKYGVQGVDKILVVTGAGMLEKSFCKQYMLSYRFTYTH